MTATTAVVGIPLLRPAAMGWPVDLKSIEPSAKFEFPPDGEMVERPFLARGTADIPSDHSLWILTRPRNNKYYTTNVSPLIIDPDDKWEFRMGIGQGEKDKNKRFDLFLVCGVAGETEIDERTQGLEPEDYVEFETLPAGVTILDHVNVTSMIPE